MASSLIQYILSVMFSEAELNRKLYIKNIDKVIITQNGKPAGVLISPKEFDKLRETKLFIDSISRGLSDSEHGEVFSTSQFKNELKKLRAAKS